MGRGTTSKSVAASTARGKTKTTGTLSSASTAATHTADAATADDDAVCAIHARHVATAYDGIWHDTHRVKQLHNCLYEPWREWVESCCDDYADRLLTRYASCLLSQQQQQHHERQRGHAAKNTAADGTAAAAPLSVGSPLWTLATVLEASMMGQRPLPHHLKGASSSSSSGGNAVPSALSLPKEFASLASVLSCSSSSPLFSHQSSYFASKAALALTPTQTNEQRLLAVLCLLIASPPIELGERVTQMKDYRSPHKKGGVAAAAVGGDTCIDSTPQQHKSSISDEGNNSSSNRHDSVPFLSLAPQMGGPSATATASVSVRSVVPCSVFEGSVVLWSQSEMVLVPEGYAAVVAFLDTVGQLIEMLLEGVVGGNGSGMDSTNTSNATREGKSKSRLETQRALFVEDSRRFLAFLAVAKTSLVVESDGDPADPFDALTGVRVGGAADGRDYDHTDAMYNVWSPSFLSSSQHQHSSASPLSRVAVVQPLVLQGMHFAPLAPRADSDEGRYAFETIIDVTDVYTTTTTVTSTTGNNTDDGGDNAAEASHNNNTKKDEEWKRLSFCGIGASPSPSPLPPLSPSLFTPTRASFAPLPQSFLCGPFAPQCCVGSFIGFAVVMKALHEGARALARATAGSSAVRRTLSVPPRGRGRGRPKRLRLEDLDPDADFDDYCGDGTEDEIPSPPSPPTADLTHLLYSTIPSLNGPVIILGMGGNVAANLVCEQLLAPTAEGRAFLAANPLFSLHVVELEPSVMRTCGLNGLLPGYEHLPSEGLLGLGAEGEEEEAMVLPIPTPMTDARDDGMRRAGAKPSTAAASNTMKVKVRRTVQTPSWLLRLNNTNKRRSSSSTKEEEEEEVQSAGEEWRRAIRDRVYYHIGVDALRTDIGELVGTAIGDRERERDGERERERGAAGGAPPSAGADVIVGGVTKRGRGKSKVTPNDAERVATAASPSPPAAAPPSPSSSARSPLIFFDCFDPVVNSISTATDVLLARFKQWLDPINGLLLVNSHFDWEGRRGAAADTEGATGEAVVATPTGAVPSGYGAARAVGPFLRVFGGGRGSNGDASPSSSHHHNNSGHDDGSGGGYARVNVWQFGAWAQYGITAFTGGGGADNASPPPLPSTSSPSLFFSLADYEACMSRLMVHPLWGKLVCGSDYHAALALAVDDVGVNKGDLTNSKKKKASSVSQITTTALKDVLRFRCLERTLAVGLAVHRAPVGRQQQRGRRTTTTIDRSVEDEEVVARRRALADYDEAIVLPPPPIVLQQPSSLPPPLPPAKGRGAAVLPHHYGSDGGCGGDRSDTNNDTMPTFGVWMGS